MAIDSRYVAAEVLAAVSAALLESFGFEGRDLAQSVTAAEVITLIHTLPGVVAVDLDELLLSTDDPVMADPTATAIPAFGARWDAATRAALPAELLLINPAGIVLEVMPT